MRDGEGDAATAAMLAGFGELGAGLFAGGSFENDGVGVGVGVGVVTSIGDGLRGGLFFLVTLRSSGCSAADSSLGICKVIIL